jgi:hypothetical protein
VYFTYNLNGVKEVSNGVKVKIRFEGQHHQMDLDTLILSLLNFAELTRAASEEVMPGQKIQIAIDATEKGSFDVLLNLFTEIQQGLLSFFNWNNIGKVSTVIGCVVGVLEIKKHLKGKKPESVQSNNNGITIITHGNSTIKVSSKVYNFYKSNAKANEHVESLFDKLVERPEIEGLTIEAEGQDTFHVASEDFVGMAQKNEMIQEKEEVRVIETNVSVLKVVFQKNRKWEFIYQGNKISAQITDERFWKEIDSFGFRFGKGDILTVKLEITQVFDHDVNTYLNKGYRVLEVIDFKQAPRQMQLDLTDE